MGLLSMVVPTRNEAGNVEQLVTRLEDAVAGPLEIIFVDDSDDETPAVIEGLRCREHPAGDGHYAEIILIHRPRGRRHGGLGGAVTLGIAAARGEVVGVMDADLQHPPALVPRLVDELERTGADLVLASRYRAGGGAEGLRRARTVVSRASTLAARLTFPHRLRGVSDPMTGFFVARKRALHLDRLQPRGFKILLEILVRHPKLRVAEIGFHFDRRLTGQSKGTLREGLRYLGHLCALRCGLRSLRFLQFAGVGASGIAINMLAFAVALMVLGSTHYLLAAALATQASTLWNYILTDLWVFADRQRRHGPLERLAMYALMNNLALVLLRAPVLYALVHVLANKPVANLISLVALTTVRYAVADALIWRRVPDGGVRSPAGGPPVYSYDIHGIITVTSDVWLPELEHFRCHRVIEQPVVRVRLGSLQSRHDDEPAAARLHYKEGLGPFGFWLDIAMIADGASRTTGNAEHDGTRFDLVVAPLLQWSPHVLYTNVVEPVLRWGFVERGYALVHGACITFGDDAYLVTARTDTGKTTTILRILQRQRRATDRAAFLSDDLTLVAPDGRALAYPKPLTISRHTVAAIKAASGSRPLKRGQGSAALTARERCMLLVQSRLHSRTGRRAALALTGSRLPMATINTVVQLLVPPPKYRVHRLVPGVKSAHQSSLAGLFVIERGPDGEEELNGEEALAILLENCADAYGFPPYAAIEGFLTQGNLAAAERCIIADAVAGCPALLLRSSRMNWSEPITQRIAGIRRVAAERAEVEPERARPSIVPAPVPET